MMKLIQSPEAGGYPTEYLISRIRGRRSYSFTAWDEILFHADPTEHLLNTQYAEFTEKYADDGVWMKLLEEYQWAYGQMSTGVKRIFLPYFSLCEMQTLFACFRYKTDRGAGTEIERLLSFSLLSGTIKELLITSPDLSDAVEAFEKKSLFPGESRRSLSDTLSEEGLAAVEKRLTALFFEQVITGKLHPVLRVFFTFLADAMNIISLYKYFRWNTNTAPGMISGGSFSRAAAIRLMHDRDMAALSRLTEKLTATHVDEHNTSHIEKALLNGLTKRVRSMAREYPDEGFILSYLWGAYMEVQNLSIILRGRDIEKDVLREELTGL